MAQVKLSQYLRKSSSRLPMVSLKLPEKYKGGRIEKVASYWKGVLGDYQQALQDIRKGARERPVRASFMLTSGMGLLYLNRHNPDELQFRDHFLRYHQDLMMVPPSIRNPDSQRERDSISRCYNLGLIRRWNFGLFSIMWRDNYSDECGLEASQVKYLKPGYLDFYDRVIDFGFLDRWWIMQTKMENFDINPNEWTIEGSPARPKEQWNPLWVKTSEEVSSS